MVFLPRDGITESVLTSTTNLQLLHIAGVPATHCDPVAHTVAHCALAGGRRRGRRMPQRGRIPSSSVSAAGCPNRTTDQATIPIERKRRRVRWLLRELEVREYELGDEGGFYVRVHEIDDDGSYFILTDFSREALEEMHYYYYYCIKTI